GVRGFDGDAERLGQIVRIGRFEFVQFLRRVVGFYVALDLLVVLGPVALGVVVALKRVLGTGDGLRGLDNMGLAVFRQRIGARLRVFVCRGRRLRRFRQACRIAGGDEGQAPLVLRGKVAG